MTNSWPTLLAKQLNLDVVNPAVNGSSLTGNVNASLGYQIAHTDVAEANVITIMIGINDLNWLSNSLDSVMQELRNQIQKITLANPTAQIVGLLPLPSWFRGTPLDFGPAGYSEQDLWRAEIDVYVGYGIPVYQWNLVTDKNHEQLYADQVVHPTQETYQLMATKLAQFISPYVKERSLSDVVNQHRFVGLPFDEIQWPTPTYSKLAISDNGTDWLTLKEYDFGWRDADIRPYNGWWYIIRTDGTARTKDWLNFENLGNQLEPDGHFSWAPEFFTTLSEEGEEDWHVIYSHDTAGNAQHFEVVVADFDKATGRISNLGQLIEADIQNGDSIDGNLFHYEDKWWLWVSTDHELRLFLSDSGYLGPYNELRTNLSGAQEKYNEAPEMYLVGNQMWLLSDPWVNGGPRNGMVVSRANPVNLSRWSALNPFNSSFPTRHFRPYLNPSTSVNLVNLKRLQSVHEINMNLSENFLRLTMFVETLNRFMKVNHMTVGAYNKLPTGVAMTSPGRSTYRLVNQGFRTLQSNLCELAKCLQKNGLVDENGNFLVAPQLEVPVGLLMNGYLLNKINRNWDSIEIMLNQINPILRTCDFL